MENETIGLLLLIAFIIGAISIVGYDIYYDSVCTYENVTAVVQDKYIDEYTTMVAGYNGKSSYVIPVHHTDYHLNTSIVDIKVNGGVYKKYDVGDNISLTRNVNTSVVTVNQLICYNLLRLLSKYNLVEDLV